MKRSLFLVLIIILALLVIGLVAVLWNLRPAGPPSLKPTPTPLEAQVLPTSTPLPPQAPITVYRSPALGEEQALDEPIIIAFDQPMDQTSVEEAFSIEPEVEGRFSWEKNDLVFTPAEPLERGESYQVTVAESARSAARLPLKEPVTFAFRTVGYLEVTDVQPAPDTEEVESDAVVTVLFNRPVVPLTSIAQQAELPHPLTFTPSVTGEGEWLNTSIYTFKPDEGFAPATTYKARVAAGLTDTTGGMLAEDYTWTFTTVMPYVLETSPRDNAIHVGPSQTISVTFNQPMDRTSAQEHFSLMAEATEEEVPGDFRWEDDETMVFVPAEDLELDTFYVAWVARGAKAAKVEGATAEDYVWSFTTVSLPYVISTYPADGDTEVEPYTGLEVEFSSPMDPDTLLPNLTILPTVTQVYSYWRNYDTSLYLSFNPEPSTAYAVTFGADMAGRYGYKLGEPYTVRFTTDALPPQVYLHSTGRVGTYNAYTTTMAYVTYRNVTRLDFRLYEMDQGTFRKLNGENWWDVWDAFKPNERDLLRRWSKEVSVPLNATRIAGTAVESEEGAGLAPGLYYLEVTALEMAKESRPSRIMMVVSGLNLTLKQSQTEALVWATDLKSGQVVADLPVSFWDEFDSLGQGKTGRDGVLQIEYEKRDTWKPIFAFAGEEGEDDFAVAMNQWSDGISPWEFNLPAESYSEPYSAHFYTDRAIYRPGQTVYFKGILRGDDDARYSLPKEVESLEVTINDDQGKELYKEKLPLNEMGTLHGELALSEEASLGYYSISAQLGQQWFGTSFQVAEYRKPEFQVAVETDRGEYVQGDEITVNVEATYYFGGPVADADVHWTVLTNDYFFRWMGRGRYDFTDYDWTQYRYYGPSGEFVTEGEGTTDAQGRFTFEVPAEIADKILSQVYTIEAAVTDVNDQQVASRTDAIVHKGLFYIGLAPQAYVGQVDEEQKVDVITVDWDSEPVPKKDLTVVFYEHKWYSVWEEGEDGRFYWQSTVEDTPVLTTTVTTDKEGKAVAAFTPEKGGVYKIAASGEDEQGNEVRSSTYLWVSGYEFINWRRENHDRIDLVTDKKSYDVGDTAQILIPSPYAGPVKALLTIERGHIMEHKLLTLETNSDLIEVPILPEYAPNVYISVVIVKGMDETEPLASFKVGYAALPVSTEEKELKLTITPDKDVEAGEHYGPRETVTYDILATDHRDKGVEAELSLQLVDLSVLALADMPGADIIEHFWRERNLGVWTGTTLVLSVDRLNLLVAPEAKGGGGGPGAEGVVRRRFPDTAYWNPAVTTDKDGRAQVSVELPDNLTTWRLGAKAITVDTQVGLTDVDVISTKDLLVRPVAPRFFVIGDEAELSAIVHNNSDQAVVAEVALEAEGVEVEGEAQMVEVPAHDNAKVSWSTKVQNAEEAKLLFSARGGGLDDAIEIVLPVYHYSTPEVVATAGQVEEDERRIEVVALPRRYDPSQGELTVEVDPSLAAGMRDGLKFLEHFPYECIEQTVSRFLPNVMTYRALKDLGVENKELEAKLPQQVSIGLQRIYAWQRYDGGWGWWLADDSNLYLTAYVLFGLNEAQRAGFAVEEDVMERAASFLKDNLIRPADIKAPYQGNTQAFVLYVLAEYGEGDLGRTVALYQQRWLLSNYGKAYLAMALDVLDPKEKTRVDSLLSDLTSAAIVSATGAHWEEETIDYWTMNTNTRSTAIVLDALARLAPESGLAPNTVRWLMVARKEGHWETTQETVWSIIALTDWMVATGELEADYSYQVTLNGETIMEGVADKDNLDEPQKIQVEVADLLQDVSNQVALERLEPTADQTGEGRLWYSMYLRYFLPVEDVKALNRGVIVARQYTLVDDPDRFVDGAQVGDVIKVKLTVIAPNDLHYVVVEDPLPAGCEALDTSLKTTSIVGEAPEVRRVTDRMWDWGWGWWWFSHTELRDEKVVLFSTYLRKGTYEYTYMMRASVPGQFLVMPSLAYEMYFPEVFGRSDGGKFTVTREE
jgi:uncharacterized protein YfaS (alpha-2-macroglobulin family)